jgi:hypothetical protein
MSNDTFPYYESIGLYKQIFGNYKNYIRYQHAKFYNDICRMVKKYETPQIYIGVL